MSIYLHDIPLDEAQRVFQDALKANGIFDSSGSEEIQLDENACGRILDEAVWARLSSPHYHASAMDGFAMRAVETIGASPSSPVTLRLDSQAHYVDTGDPLPDGMDAVVPIENIEPVDYLGQIDRENIRNPHAIRLRSAYAPWQHVRPMGEDIVATQLILEEGHVLRPVDLGAIAAGGFSKVRVRRKPRVAILPTGTELVPIGSALQRGDILEYNSVVLAAQVKTWGGSPVRYPISPDRFEILLERVRQAAEESDLVLINAGSSAGSEDFSARVVEMVGDLLVHGVAVRPGHPVILGMARCKDGKYTPIIGVPGYPVSAALTGEIFVRPILKRWSGMGDYEDEEVEAQITRKTSSPAGDDDYIRVILGQVDGRLLAAPLSRGAGVITSLVRADGITIAPRGVQGFEAGTKVKVHLLRSREVIQNSILAIGSHDLSLDVLSKHLAKYKRRLVSSNVGSQGGLVALRRNEAHLAGTHLLDPETGQYNTPYLQEYLSKQNMVLVTWVYRVQGLIVPQGNPKQIHRVEDLTRRDVKFINRQRGAGTRVLLDYHIKKIGIVTGDIQGYEQEEYTHLAIAAAIESGRADCGMGIASAATALHLDFIPLFKERYDLLFSEQSYNSELLRPLIGLFTDPTTLQEVASMPGYDVSEAGKIVFQGVV